MRIDNIQLFGTGSGLGTIPTSSFAVSSSFSQPSIGPMINGGAMDISAVSSNPTKGTTTNDVVSYRKLGPKVWEVWYQFALSGNGSNGSGDYLLLLPNGLQFDTSVPTQQVNTTSNRWFEYGLGIGAGYCTFNGGSYQAGVFAQVYSSYRFRVMQWRQFNTDAFWGSGDGGMGSGKKLSLRFTFIST